MRTECTQAFATLNLTVSLNRMIVRLPKLTGRLLVFDIIAHTLERGGSRPEIELEADEFSGFVLRKMGATLPQA